MASRVRGRTELGTEIERKFLVTGAGYKHGIVGDLYRQGYLSTAKERTVRVRTAAGKGFLTVKGPNVGFSRSEFEYEIPLRDAEEMMSLCEGFLIEKLRHRVSHSGLTWEVDEFLGANEGLVVAEIELKAEGQHFELPSWIGEEVTSDPRYANSNLCRKPYKSWG